MALALCEGAALNAGSSGEAVPGGPSFVFGATPLHTVRVRLVPTNFQPGDTHPLGGATASVSCRSHAHAVEVGTHRLPASAPQPGDWYLYRSSQTACAWTVTYQRRSQVRSAP